MSHLIIRVFTPYLRGILWVLAAILLLHPGNGISIAISSGIVLGFSLIISIRFKSFSSSTPHPIIHPEHVLSLGLFGIWIGFAIPYGVVLGYPAEGAQTLLADICAKTREVGSAMVIAGGIGIIGNKFLGAQ